ncbi:MAG: hypothetical protein KAT58_10435 [candidate division Zixibacteria bacterium]|nr:hypothetical protein [candidate division Zixibacteria bacterium]
MLDDFFTDSLDFDFLLLPDDFFTPAEWEEPLNFLTVRLRYSLDLADLLLPDGLLLMVELDFLEGLLVLLTLPDLAEESCRFFLVGS